MSMRMSSGIMLEGLPCTLVKFPSTARAGVTDWQPNQWHQHFQFTTFVTSKAQRFLAPGVSRLSMLPECRADWVPRAGVLKWFWTLCGIWVLSTFRYAHSSHHSFLFKVLLVCTDIRLPHPTISQVFISKADHGLFWWGSSHSEKFSHPLKWQNTHHVL